MCLYIDRFKFKTAEKDIPCWKVLEIIEGTDGEEITVTPYAFARVDERVLNGEAPFRPDMRQRRGLDEEIQICLNKYGEEDCSRLLSVDKGVVHSYDASSGAVQDMYSELAFHAMCIGRNDTYIKKSDALRIGCGCEPRILGVSLWKCVIPKGAEYVKGRYYGRYAFFTSYGSSALVFKEKIHEWRGDQLQDTWYDVSHKMETDGAAAEVKTENEE